MLRLENIRKRYGEKTVIRDLSCTVRAGTLTVVAGPNGAGKSTLLRLMAGLARPDSGTVTVSCDPGGVGYLGHETFLYPHLTALENLAFWQKLHAKPADDETLLAALDGMGLAALADEKAGTFSRGTAQRLSLTRVFLQGPSLLLLDEPLSGLDEASGKRVREGLAALRDTGAALVWVSHDPAKDAWDADAVIQLLPGGSHRILTPSEYGADDFGMPETLPASGGTPC
ncbi:ABC transporter [uncultured delta proteobacterium]|uniref:ABC transporter n=1 Tax=uncultured delta proteobacterium TaxID=34034 RepID=A0A212JAE5_9DELT|nr:ABC transporter [uncultured delta proteobacterium]